MGRKKPKKEEAKITRRQMLAYTGVLTAAIASGAYLVTREGPEEKIMHERQKKIEELAEKHQSPYVKAVHYDPNKSKIREFPKRYADSIFNDEKKWGWVVEYLQEGFKEKGFSEKGTKEYLNKRETRQKLEDMIRKSLEESIEYDIAKDPAQIPCYLPFMGRGEKSEIYFFDKAFEREQRKIMGKPFEVEPKEKLWVIYQHECVHARDIATGLEIGGILINYKNLNKVDPDLLNAIEESNAYIETFEHFKPYWMSMPLLYSALKLGGFLEQFKKFTESKKFKPTDEWLIEKQVARYNEVIPDANRLFEEYAKSK